MTQGDLIAEALETEEINRASLLAFYAAEEDRRMADRIAGMRYEIIGPKITFLSRLEGVERKVQKGKGKEGEVVGTKTAAEKLESGRRRLIEVIGEAGKEGWRPNSGMGDPAPIASSSKAVSINGSTSSPLASPSLPSVPLTSTSSNALASTSKITNGNTYPFPLASLEAAAASTIASSSSSSSSSPKIKSNSNPNSTGHARNYLILEGFEPTKEQEMSAIFGNHHEWGSVKVIPARNRVLSRSTSPYLSVFHLPLTNFLSFLFPSS